MGQFIPHSAFRIRHSLRRGLTLVEMLIVIVVIGILVSAILVAASSFVNKGKANNTQAVLQLVSDAVQQFKTDQSAKPTITSVRSYAERYGLYPPDELEVFTAAGLPGSTGTGNRSLAPGKAVIYPTNPFQPMRFYKDGTPQDYVEHRDMLAMVVAIETLSESASAILDRVPDRNRTAGAIDENGKPTLFLDRPDVSRNPPEPNGTWDPGDHQIRYIVDDWGNPISYLAQRDWKDDSTNVDSSNHEAWNEASTELIRLNGGQPIIVSYGPDGKEQLTKGNMEPNARASLVGDFEENDDHVVNNPLNDDNVYANPGFREKLAKGLPQQ